MPFNVVHTARSCTTWTWQGAYVSGESPEVIEAAADLMNIDLLITADTMLAHLAGALGIAVWMLRRLQPTGAGCWIARTRRGIRL